MNTLTAEELHSKLGAGENVLLIDVRQPEEILHGTLTNAKLFPLPDVVARVEEIKKIINDHTGATVIFCRSGGRSEQVINYLEQSVSKELFNLIGGTNEYSQFDSSIRKY